MSYKRLTSRKELVSVTRWVPTSEDLKKPLANRSALNSEEFRPNLIAQAGKAIRTQIASLREVATAAIAREGKDPSRYQDKAGDIKFEEVPYQFHGLEKRLSLDAKLAVATVRGLYDGDSKLLFQFRGGRLLFSAFPGCPPDFAKELCKLVANGTETDADFVLAVVQNYRGEPSTHEILKQIVSKYPKDASKFAKIKVSFDNTGVVWGEFGMVNAYRAKKAAIASWLDDARPEVKSFAENHIRELDLQIASEQKRADESKEIRKLEFENENNYDGES